MEQVEQKERGIEELSEEQIAYILAYAQSPDVIVPLQIPREDVNRVKAVKVSDTEKERIQKFQDYLYGIGFLEENTFSELFAYCFNLAFTWHKKLTESEAKKERG